MTISNQQKGTLLVIASTFFFSIMQGSAAVTSDNITIMEQVFARNLIAAVFSFIMVKRNKVSYFGKMENQKYLMLRSSCGFLSLIALFYASSNASQGDVAIINKLLPFVVTILAVLILKEKLTKVQVPAIIIAFIGAYVVANPSFNSNIIPLLSAFFSAVASGIAYTMLAMLKDKEHPMTVVLHFSVFSTICAAPFFILRASIPSLFDGVMLIIIGICGLLGQVAITYGYRLAKAAEVSIYTYCGIIFSIIFGWLFLGERIQLRTLVGALIITGASLLVHFYRKRLEKKGEAVAPIPAAEQVKGG